jgi:hypothetical protein
VQKRKTTAPSTSTTRKKAAGTSKKVKDAPAKLAYEMTDEETKAYVDAEVKSKIALVQPEPKLKIDSKTRQHFVDMLERPSSHVANLASDYNALY